MASLMASSCMDKLPDNTEIDEIPGITGNVTDEKQNPIEHIKVTFSWGNGIEDSVVYTSSKGEFKTAVPSEIRGIECQVSLTVEDVDGEENGGEFETVTDKIMLFQKNEEYTSSVISLDYHLTHATPSESSPQS